ncbi:MAG: sodium:proline symporter, partial [Candidatus Eisenbacteria bacterium]|nr:sodium:proline symporter [Candidatus Eisenbacteria bacterium]
ALAVQWWSWKYSDGGGVLIQRMSATKDERHSTLSMVWFTFGNYVVRPWPWFVVALISLAVFPDLTDHKSAYPMMMTRFLGPGLLGLLMAGILAAFMSTVDTHINLASSYFVNDIYRRFLRPRAAERHYVWVGRLAGVAFIVIGALIALFSTSIVRLFEFLLQLISGAGAVFLLRWFWWRINAWSEIAAMAASLLTATLLNLSNRFGWAGHVFATWEILLLNVGLSGAIWLAVTFLTPPTDSAHLSAFYRRVRPGGFWGPIAAMADARGERERGEADDEGEEAPAPRWSARRPFESFLLTLVLVYGGLIGVGHLLYGKLPSGALLCAAGLAAAARIAWNLRRPRSGA